MPVDPMIARGVQPIEFGNTLMQIAALKQRDQAIAQSGQEFEANQQYRNALLQDQRKAQERAVRQAEEDDAEWDAAYQAKDWGTMAKIDPQVTRVLWDQEQSLKPPGPIQFKRTPWGGQYAEQDGQRVPGLEWNPPAPQQYGPATYSNVTVMENGKPVVYAVNTRNPSERVRVGDAVANEAESVDVKAQVERAKREQAWNLYSTARDGLVSGLEGATTNPLVGRLPAVTARQQVAEGSVAAMAPVLKQLFRVAGEGVFTDRDQQLLLDMVPKRTDLPAARAEKIANIDRIVKAKLGLDSAQPEAAEGGLTPEEQAELQQLRQRFGR